MSPGLVQAQPAGCSHVDAVHAQENAVPLCVLSPEGGLVARFSVEIADTDEKRAQGLMGRTQLKPGAGMLFVYPSPRPVAFWMHNTLIPLDMIFVDDAGRITNVHANARPLDETPIPSRGPAQYVLEIGGGQAARLGLLPGMVLQPLP
ncbi:hypothetical protein C8J27_107170 [Rhodobacter aestuarii]|uniref:DUF192 domain-containing protein n=1 Tax=Rhodobacter aestuarii TaxID=453582 RepID=A0A1N7NPG5_9RHOB|nr:DUF192 domain-containing protein [Rhodobacter aestuarii]PTV94638.1 hypothetical protein C8J27_107170 [Rhodobacter aestuarii]SIT00224.1 hypothetical protein SAMN05421580_10857 [Rhodobacter aestuarii]